MKSSNLKNTIYIGFSLALLALSFLLLYSSNFRGLIQNKFFSPPAKKIIASLEVKTPDDKTKFQFLKIQKKYNLVLEAYTTGEKQIKIGTIDLGPARDAQFRVKTQLSSMAAQDIDGDSFKEILIPLFDSKNQKQIVIIKFNPTELSLTKISTKSLLPQL